MAQQTSARPPAGALAGSGTEAADRVADVLLYFTRGPAAAGVTEVARELDLSKAVVHRILQSLVSRGFVASDPGSREYRLGSSAVALGARALRDRDLRKAARNVLRTLRDATGETTTLSELVLQQRVYLDQFASPQEIKMMVELGRPHPLHAGGSSRAILAFLPPEQQEAALAPPLPALTDRTVTDVAQLRQLLVEVRRTGVATSLGERQAGAGSIAAPVFGMDGEVVGAISVCGPVARFTPETLATFSPLVRQAAQQISETMGWAGDGTS